MPSGQSAVSALRRGDVSLIEHVPPDQVVGLAASPEIKVGQYAKPVVHFLALDGRNPALRSRSLRRGLSYAVDRKALLEDYVSSARRPTPDAVCRRAVSQGELRRRAGRQAARRPSVAGEDAGGRRPQGAGQRPDQAQSRVSVDSGGARDRAQARRGVSPGGRRDRADRGCPLAARRRAALRQAVRPGLPRAEVRRAGARGRAPALPRL